MRNALIFGVRLILALIAAAAPAAAQQSMLSYVPITYGYSLRGTPVSHLAGAGDKAVVLFFLATDCPVSNRYVPEIKRIQAEFAARKVAFWLVYPNPGDTPASVTSHQSEYRMTPDSNPPGGGDGHVLVRPTPPLLHEAAAKITPEAAILLPTESGGREVLHAVYTGRIDDRYLSIGRERPKATQHDLERAITAVLENQPVPPPGGPPVGCGIIPASMMTPGAAKP